MDNADNDTDYARIKKDCKKVMNMKSFTQSNALNKHLALMDAKRYSNCWQLNPIGHLQGRAPDLLL